MFASGSEPTIKALLFLALLEHEGRECDYGKLLATIKREAGIELTRESLRVAVRDLTRTLDRSATPFQVKHKAKGLYQLDRRREPRGFHHDAGSRSAVPFMEMSLDHPLGQQRRLVENLMSRRVVPPYSLFFLPVSAALWTTFVSNEEKEYRGRKEAEAWDLFDIGKRLEPKNFTVLSIVGLSVGEGYGELDLLRRILSRDDRTVVHYLAIDISPGLLLSHLQHLQLEFSDSMLSGHLVCAGVVADGFDLAPARNKLCTKWDAIWRARELVSADFLPRASPWIVTYFGNAMGNEEQNSEWRFFEVLRTRLGDDYRDGAADCGDAGSLHVIVGVAALDWEQDSREDPERDRQAHKAEMEAKFGDKYRSFFLTGPRHLAEYGFLVHDGEEQPFSPREGSGEIRESVNVASSVYVGSFRLGGWRRVFGYTLGCRIKSSVDERLVLNKGAEIQLGAIVEYDMRTMKAFVEEMGFRVVGPGDGRDGRPGWYEELMVDGNRRYAVFCAELVKREAE